MSSNKREEHIIVFDISGCISCYKMFSTCGTNKKLSHNPMFANVNRTHTSTPSLTSSTSIWNLLVPPLACFDWFPIPELHLLPLENNNPSSLSTSLFQCCTKSTLNAKHRLRENHRTNWIINQTNLLFLRVFIVHSWFSFCVSTYTGFEISLQGLASKTDEKKGKTHSTIVMIFFLSPFNFWRYNNNKFKLFASCL